MDRLPAVVRARLSVVRERRRLDTTSVLTLLVVLLLAIPSQLVFGPLGAAGSPAQLFGLVLLLWWVFTRILGARRESGPAMWVQVAAVVYLAAVLASYVAATVRPIESIELRAADRSILSTLAWLGILFLAMDGITSRERLDTLLRRICVAGGLLAILGLIQFVTKSAIVDSISIPGLTANQQIYGAADRGGFTRPAGTSIHPLEYGSVLTLIFPLALHYGIVDRRRRGIRSWWPALFIGSVLMLSLSRSAIFATVVVLVVMLPGWPSAWRRRLYALMAVMFAVVFVAVPGMIGTITRLFTGVAGDNSALSRTDSYALAWEFIKQSPLFGRGIGTFLPQYRILDNQYLGSIIEIGFVGTAALLGLFITPICLSWRNRHRMSTTGQQSLARCMAASIAACGVSFATFDAFSFPMVPTLLFLIIGCAAALVHLDSVDSAALAPSVAAVT